MGKSMFELLETRRLMSASLRAGVLTVNGTENNDIITIEQLNAAIRVNDNGTVRSYSAAQVNSIVVNGKAGSDRISLADGMLTRSSLNGGAGNDTLRGGTGADRLSGGTEDDTMDGGFGADQFLGGDGRDLVDYSARRANLYVAIDNYANDGEGSEGDNVRTDVENVRTGSGNDRLTGSASNNFLDSGDGSDTINGAGGNDFLVTGTSNTDMGVDFVYGGEGEDVIRATRAPLNAFGEAGNDTIDGGASSDVLHGGDGNDRMRGGEGFDVLDGGYGNDILRGGAGNDTLRGGWGDDLVHGDDGDDTMWGQAEPRPVRRGPGGIIIDPVISFLNVTDKDAMWGGAGNDTMRGGNGDDGMWGEDGNDAIHGENGFDVLYGNAGHDNLFGGADNDEMYGGAGQDTLVSIGGGTDKLRGEGDGDQFWKDSSSAETTDADLGEILFGAVHEVGGFANNVSRELNGQNLPDPGALDRNVIANPTDDFNPTFTNFRETPLFSAAGISERDVQQGQTGDCYFLAAVAGAAKQSKYRITQSIVDLGDGTYAVKFVRNGSDHVYYRVDADLPVTTAGGSVPYYAGLGANFSLWVAVMEKAFCFFRGGGTYESIDHGPAREAFNALGLRDAGNLFVSGNGMQTLINIRNAMANGRIVTLETMDPAIPASVPALSDHLYVVDRVNTMKIWIPGKPSGGIFGNFSSGKFVEIITSITLRNPWGNDGKGNDGSNDGLVTLTAQQIQDNFIGAEAAWA